MSDADAVDAVDVGDLSDLPDGGMRVFPDLGDGGVVVCRVAGALHAVADTCSHADARLHEGRLRGAMLICPRHGAAFDVRDGSHQGPPAWEGIACYRVVEQDGRVAVEVARRDGAARPGRDVGGRFEVR